MIHSPSHFRKAGSGFPCPRVMRSLSLEDSMTSNSKCALPVWSVTPQALGTVEASKRTELICLQYLCPRASLNIGFVESRQFQLPKQLSSRVRAAELTSRLPRFLGDSL